MERTLASCLGGLLMAALPTVTGAADLALVVAGKPNAVIIAADEPHARRAAAEIQKYVAKISVAPLIFAPYF